jgi:hypothetical protein
MILVACAPVRMVRLGRVERNAWMYALFELLRAPLRTVDWVQPTPIGLPAFMSCWYGNSASSFVVWMTGASSETDEIGSETLSGPVV